MTSFGDNMEDKIMEGQIRHISKNVKFLWILNVSIVGLIVWIIFSIIAIHSFPEVFLGIHKNLYPIIFLILYLLIIGLYWIWLGIVYENITYYLTDDEIVIKSGVFKVDRIVIPFDKIQNVNITRSVLERLLNIATIKIETAGGREEYAEGVLEGIEEYAELANEIIRRVDLKKELRKIKEKSKESSEKEKKDRLNELFEEIQFIKSELKRLRKEINYKKNEFLPMISDFEFEKIEKNKKRSNKKKK